MQKTPIHNLFYNSSYLEKKVRICGWVRTLRSQKTFSFLQINDGSSVESLQVVIEDTFPNYSSLIKELSTGASVQVTGLVVRSQGKRQTVEMQPENIEIIGPCPEDYPLQKKRHSFAYLRSISHLRPRTNTQGACLRMRSMISFAVHQFFQQEGFFHIHTPIITTLDCEGAGEMFRITKDGKDFFGLPAYLTVSGQLEAEICALALSNVYTFGPTFRAENSNTSRHLAEFWMIEPEMAFCELAENMEMAEKFLRYILTYALEKGGKDLAFFSQFIEEGLTEKLEGFLKEPFAKLSYTEAIEILQKAPAKFIYPPKWGHDLQSEHERYLAESYAKKPVIVYDYPKEIKAFYMKENDDGKSVRAMDLLVPKIGELIGGSEREDREDILKKKMENIGLSFADYSWYLELRKYGSCPHSGFGVGFERLLQLITGMENIRDTIPFPRFPGHASFQ